MLDNLVSIHPFLAKDDLFDEYRDDPDEFKYEDDVDSNDEGNDRNEYPDEDDDESDDDRKRRKKNRSKKRKPKSSSKDTILTKVDKILDLKKKGNRKKYSEDKMMRQVDKILFADISSSVTAHLLCL